MLCKLCKFIVVTISSRPTKPSTAKLAVWECKKRIIHVTFVSLRLFNRKKCRRNSYIRRYRPTVNYVSEV